MPDRPETEFSEDLWGTGGTIDGSSGDDNITGTSKGETIYLGGGNDTLDAGGGNDLIFAYGADLRTGEDVIDGGDGIDILVLPNISGVEIIDNGDSFTVDEGATWQGPSSKLTVTNVEYILGLEDIRSDLQHLNSDPLKGYIGPLQQIGLPQLPFGFPGHGDEVNLDDRTAEIVDINGDGYMDIVTEVVSSAAFEFIANGAGNSPDDMWGQRPIKIFLGGPNGTLRDGTAEVMADPNVPVDWLTKISVADFNNDGVLDIFATAAGFDDGNPADFTLGQNELFLSGSDGKLHHVTATNLPQKEGFYHGSDYADVDGDGDLDIFVSHLGGPSFMMLNDGTGKFTYDIDISNDGRDNPAIENNSADGFKPGDQFEGFPEGIWWDNGENLLNSAWWTAFIDADGDGDPDLVVLGGESYSGNTPRRDFLLLNDGTGNFDLAPESHLPETTDFGVNFSKRFPQHAIVMDINGDGLDDLFIHRSFSNVDGGRDEDEGGSYYQILISNGDGSFRDETVPRILNNDHTTLSTDFSWAWSHADINADGAPDLISNDNGRFLLNDGNGYFRHIDDIFPAPLSFAPIDLNGDNVLDFVINEVGGQVDGANQYYTSIYLATEPFDINHYDGNDTRTGGTGADALVGGFGNDILKGLAGADSLIGGEGADALWAGAGDDSGDYMDGGNGNDTIGGGAGGDLLIGGFGLDLIYGGTDNDTIWGAEQNTNSNTSGDTIWAGDGNDLIHAAAGADALGGGTGDDTINGGSGGDVIYGGKGDGADHINGEGGDDKIFGASGNDSLSGGNGADTIFNGAGNDTVDGGAVGDTLWGGGGDDLFTGGTGTDTFAFASGNGHDTITDFTASDDKLDLSGLDIADLNALTALASDTAAGLVLTIDDAMAITLQGLTVANLSSLDIIF